MKRETGLEPDAAAGLRLVDLGVNLGRAQRDGDHDNSAHSFVACVVIDVHPTGGFTVYADRDVQVLCRCAHIPEDDLVRVNHRAIPEQWLTSPVGCEGDGSVADLVAEAAGDWLEGRCS
jgi:hypothetical protein